MKKSTIIHIWSLFQAYFYFCQDHRSNVQKVITFVIWLTNLWVFIFCHHFSIAKWYLICYNLKELQKQLGPNVVIDKKQVAGILTAQWNELPFERKQVMFDRNLIFLRNIWFYNFVKFFNKILIINNFFITGIFQATRRSEKRISHRNEKIQRLQRNKPIVFPPKFVKLY